MAKPVFYDRKLVDVCIAAAGSARRGGVVAMRLIQWATVSESLGHFASTREYAEWTYVDERTAFRHRAAIRAVFDEAQFQLLVDELVKQGAAKTSRRRALALTVRLAS